VKNWFQSFAFTSNLYRYTVVAAWRAGIGSPPIGATPFGSGGGDAAAVAAAAASYYVDAAAAVGGCTRF
jgi:hypothetical protein